MDLENFISEWLQSLCVDVFGFLLFFGYQVVISETVVCKVYLRVYSNHRASKFMLLPHAMSKKAE